MHKLINIISEQNIPKITTLKTILDPEYIFLPINKDEQINEDIYKEELFQNHYSSISGHITSKVKINNKTYLLIENNYKEDLKKSIHANKNINSLTIDDLKKIIPKYNFLFNRKIDKLYINCLEIEPTFYNNAFLIKSEYQNLIAMAETILTIFQLDSVTFLFESKESDILEEFNLNIGSSPNIRIKMLPSGYYLGNSSVLSKYLNLNKSEQILNVKDLYKIYLIVKRNRQLTEKYISITGNAIKKPITLKVKLYTRLSSYFSYIELTTKKYEILLNNSLYGKSIKDIIIDDKVDGIIINKINNYVASDCSMCGLCYKVCPLGINPLKKDSRCLKCGLCNYVCPSKINIIKENQEDE